jgi:hypothetical protein
VSFVANSIFEAVVTNKIFSLMTDIVNLSIYVEDVNNIRLSIKVWEHYVISDAPPIFMKIGNLVYVRVLIYLLLLFVIYFMGSSQLFYFHHN